MVDNISNITTHSNNKFLTTHNTGYMALGAVSLTTLSAVAPIKPLKKYHKHFGFLTLGLILLHLECANKHRQEKNKQLNLVG